MTGIGGWRLVLATLLAAAALLGARTRAEVGVYSSPSAQRVGGPYQILELITEEGDPFGMWSYDAASNGPDRVVLNPDGDINGDGRPSMLRNPVSDLPVVVWARNTASGFDVVVSHFVSGAWSSPELVAGGAADELDPWITADPVDGTVHLLYWVDGVVPVVMHRQAPADLSSWSAPSLVSDGVEPSYRPSAVIHDGVLHVAYEVHPFGQGQTPREIVVADKDGQDFYAQVVGVSGHDAELWPQIHSHSGKLWLEWIDADDEMAWIRLESGGWSVPRYEVFVTPEDLEIHVRGKIRLKAIVPPS